MRATFGRYELCKGCSRLAVSALFCWLALTLLARHASAQSGTATAAGPAASARAPAPNPATPSSASAPAASSAEPPRSESAADVPNGAKEPPQPAKPESSSLQLQHLEELATNLERLGQGKLDDHVSPASLFTVDLEDAEAVRLEVRRLAAIVEAADDQEASAEHGEPADATATAAPAIDPALWEASLEVDRARLSFLRLPPEERQRLLEEHADRQKAAAGDTAQRALNDTRDKAHAAEKARQEALRAAKQARTEAARLIVEEKARLLDITKQQADYEAELLKEKQALKARQEAFLGLQRQVREAVKAPHDTTPEGMNALYDRVRAALREARTALASVTHTLVSGVDPAPEPGGDRLSHVPSDIDKAGVEQLRRKLATEADRLEAQRAALMHELGAELYDEVVGFNSSRLLLLSHVSDEKRAAITGLGPAGIDQALGEAEQVSVVLRYHLAATLDWAARMQAPGAGRGQSAVAAGIQALKWLVPLLVFVWWRRRAERGLLLLQEWLTNSRARRGVAPGRAEAFVEYLRRVRSTAEWLILMWVAVALLPVSAAGLLEVKLLQQIVTWSLGGSLVVKTLDSIAGRHAEHHEHGGHSQTARLRLRSLRLVGRVVVGFGLLLALTGELVGKGTIYGWVFRGCWFAAVPVLFIVVRWYAPVIFERIGNKRKQTALERWIIQNQGGWYGFFAAGLGGALLLASGSYRVAKLWLTDFELSRRILAYLFRKEINKYAGNRAELVLRPLPPELADKLSPERFSTSLVPSVADAQAEQLTACIDAPGGGVFAIVGERGAGKSTLLARVEQQAQRVKVVHCPFGGIERFRTSLLQTLGGGAQAPLERAAELAEKDARGHGILVDDAHRLISPSMGGLAHFDHVLQVVRQHSQHTSWVFAFDERIWQFLERMRGSHPLFDKVIYLDAWREAGIVKLLTQRSRDAELKASFTHLLGDLPSDADEIDVADALHRTEAAYYRLIWDYAGGNPGVALTAWRDSLGIDPSGQANVKVFRAPDAEDLEGLPENASFVFRAIVQLERANIEQICHATGIAKHEVQDAVRFGLARGYFEIDEDGYGVTWPWFRAITRFLTRRHLLVPRRKESHA